MRGAFQAGAVAEVLQQGFAPDAIYGVSVGSLNGAFLADRAGRAARRDGTPDWPRIGDELETFWRTRVTSPAAVGKVRTALTLARDLVTGDFQGLIDSSNLRALLRSELKAENLRNSPARLSVGVVNAATGEYCDVGAESPHIVDYVFASASIPLLMPIPRIAGQPVLDGGLRQVTPLKAALANGARDIVCVVCQAPRVSHAASAWRTPVQLLGRLTDIISNEMVNREIAWARGVVDRGARRQRRASRCGCDGRRGMSLTVVRPSVDPDIDMCAFTSRQIAELLAQGREAARQTRRVSSTPEAARRRRGRRPQYASDSGSTALAGAR